MADPALYEELRDYFCYAQLTTQPLDATDSFAIDGGSTIPVQPPNQREPRLAQHCAGAAVVLCLQAMSCGLCGNRFAMPALAVAGHVPVAALPDLMRAAGHYPSDADTESLLAHVRFLADMAPADDTLMCR